MCVQVRKVAGICLELAQLKQVPIPIVIDGPIQIGRNPAQICTNHIDVRLLRVKAQDVATAGFLQTARFIQLALVDIAVVKVMDLFLHREVQLRMARHHRIKPRRPRLHCTDTQEQIAEYFRFLHCDLTLRHVFVALVKGQQKKVKRTTTETLLRTKRRDTCSVSERLKGRYVMTSDNRRLAQIETRNDAMRAAAAQFQKDLLAGKATLRDLPRLKQQYPSFGVMPR
mmetsp:Transcript_23219/g.39895  ORF Transcript_23219/g.39895 Transcript_23219/m.39895 type:complete len:227 (-) Transcript_23219:8-688(-)